MVYMKLKTYYVDVRFEVPTCEHQDDAEAYIKECLTFGHLHREMLETGKVVSVQEKESCQPLADYNSFFVRKTPQTKEEEEEMKRIYQEVKSLVTESCQK